MPQVPYQPYPNVSPQAPGERISVSTPGAAFGENVGAALSHLGSSVDQVGNELFGRAMALQEVSNEAEARDLQLQHAQQTAPLMADFDALKGNAPKARLLGYLKDLEAIRQQLSGAASNPDVRRRFLNDTAGFSQREIFSAGRHAGDEFKNYTVGSAVAHADLQAKNWTDAEKQGEIEGKAANVQKASETIAGANGWSKDQLDDWVFKKTSETVYKSQINELATLGKTEKGFELLEKYKNEGKITQPDYDVAQKALFHHNEATGGEFLAKKIDREMKDASFEQKMARVEELAPKYAHGDPDFQTVVEHHLRTVNALDNKISQDNLNHNLQTIYQKIRRGDINTFQQLLANPDTKAAYDAMPEGKEKIGIPKTIANAVLARDFETRVEVRRSLDGMANDPAQRLEFLKVDPFDPKLHLSLADQEHFLSLRAKLIKAPLDDPFVKQGWATMRQQMYGQLTDLGIVSKQTGKEDPKKANLLRGGMVIALQEFMDKNKRPPDGQEFMEKIAKPLIKTHAESAWLGLSHRDVPEYARTESKEKIEEATKELTEAAQKAGADPPSPREVGAYIIHGRWKQFFQGSKASPDGKPAPIPE